MSKKAERRSRTENKQNSRMWYLKKIHNSDSELPDRKIGRCRKHHPYDCGNSKCFCCHSNKIGKEPTRQEVQSDLDMKEDLF